MEIQEIIETLNPDEKTILPYLKEKTLSNIAEKTNLDKVRVFRALQYLENKGIIVMTSKEKKTVDLDKNGVCYLKHGLPERRLINFLEKETSLDIKQGKEKTGLSENEFKAALGALKKKALINLTRGKIILSGTKKEITKKSLEEQFLESLPAQLKDLSPEQKFAFENLKKRKQIIEVKNEKKVDIKLTELGKKASEQDLSKLNLIENLTTEIIKSGKWRGKKFRKYDIKSKVPEISGGKKHFVNQSIDYARKIWAELGFKEMTPEAGNLIQTGFWNFDALFQPQDHPARDMHDTFYLDVQGKLPDKKLTGKIKKIHESGDSGSKGWNYKWQEKQAKKVLLRPHTTCLSAQTLYQLSQSKEKNKQGKYFSLGKVFRNETLDWSHGFEFYQTEGIVIGKNLNLKHLLGYLKEFYKKMGFEKIRFTPAYFPYTEPSVEVNVWHPEKKVWLELGGSGILRPEVTSPLLGKDYTVLAWGLGFDRIITDYYNIKDLREMYKNNIKQLREKKFWIK